MQRLQALLLFAALLPLLPAADDSESGKALFQNHCAVCHKEGAVGRTPLPEALARLPKLQIIDALTNGVMAAQGADLSLAQRSAIADFLTAGQQRPSEAQTTANTCPGAAAPLSKLEGWNGWGVDLANTRFQPASLAGISSADLPKLKLKWAFGFAGSPVANAQPAIAGNQMFFGSPNGTVYAGDVRTGCIYWTFKAPDGVRSAISLGKLNDNRIAAYFGDSKANVYALDAQTGQQIWKTKVDEHPVARVTGSPKLYKGRLYVPVSSIEEVSAGSAKYACCKFRGSVVALDAETGKQIWKTYAIPDAPTLQGNSASGAEKYGPAGAAIWSSPTIDAKRNVLYVGTGNLYAEPLSKYSDAVIAMDLDSGSMKWAEQMTPKDGWNYSCVNPTNPVSCPKEVGPDVDIGASPILKTVAGRDFLVIGQKSGIVHVLDPDKKGAILWQKRIAAGGPQGGIMWGLASDADQVYVPRSDIALSKVPEGQELPGGGLFAFKIATGDLAWQVDPEKPACIGKIGCSPAQLAPVTAIPGVVFSGSMDGHLRAYSTKDGKKLWDFDTLQNFDTVNGVRAKGGSMNATGPVIVNGMLLVNSGYGTLGGMAGNVLLAFSVEGK